MRDPIKKETADQGYRLGDMSQEKYDELSTAIKRWTTVRQRLEIGKQFSVYSIRQIYKVMSGKSKNFELLTALIVQAEENKNLFQRAHQLVSHE